MNTCAVSPVCRLDATAETLATPELVAVWNRRAILKLAFERGLWEVTFGEACKVDVFTKYALRGMEPELRARVVARPPVELCHV